MIPEIIPVKNYSGNGTTTKFDFDFYIENENQLVVYHTNKDGEQTLLELGKDYTINEIGQENGSFITFPITGSDYPILQGESSYGVGDAEKISLCLYLPISQETEYGTSDKLDLQSLEYSLDYLTRLIQILNRQMERSVKVPEGAGQTADDLIEVLQQAQIKASESASLAESSATQSAQSAEKAEESYNKSVGILSQIEQTGIDNKANRNLDNIDWDNLDQRAKDSLGATIKTYQDLMTANGKNVVFGCASDSPVAIDYIDGTSASLTNIPNLDMSNQSAGTYKIACDKQGNPMVSSIAGDLTIQNGVASGFTNSNYFAKTVDFGTTKETMFPIVIPFITGDNVTTRQTLLTSLYNVAVNLATSGKLDLSLSSNGTAFDIADSVAGSTVLQVNTRYKVVVDYDGTNYTLELTNLDSEEATTTTEITIASESLIIGGEKTTRIGNAIASDMHFMGSIDIASYTIAGNPIIDESLPLGTVTLTDDIITNITNNHYVAMQEEPLQEVDLHTDTSYADSIGQVQTGKLPLVPFNFVNPNWSDYVAVTANTECKYSRDGKFYANSSATIKMTEADGTVVSIVGTELNVKAGDSFTSTVAGKFYFYY